jgi:ankyrin repeat protein
MISRAFTRGFALDCQRRCALLHRSNEGGFRVLASILAVLVAMAASGVQASDEDLPLNATLLVAARSADGPAIARALQQGAAVNSRNRLGESALIVVLKKDRVDLARALLDAGADVNQAALNGVTPLMAAAYGGHTEIVRALVAKGADIAAVDRLKKNAIIYAAGEGRTDIVKLLLDKGVDPNAVYANDLTALMWAAGYGQTEAVKTLLAAGAKTSLKDNRGKTAADIAREAKHEETARLLAQTAERP